jgi:hypothetical protein
MQLIALIRCVLVTIGSQMPLVFSATACPFEKFSDSPHIRVAQSPWVVDTWGQACGFGVSGGMEIRALNEKTQETKTIATLSDITVITVSSDEPNSLTITLPNLVDMTDAAAQFGDVKVLYKFTPSDDPEARTHFQRWKHHPDDPQARDWYCRNIFAKMDPVNRASWNAIIGQSFPANRAAGRKYCLEQ